MALPLAGLSGLACAAAAPSLYERIGGAPKIEAITTALIDAASRDPATKRSFEGVTLSRLKLHLAQMLCQLTGGDCVAQPDSVKEIHAGLGIDQHEFYGLVEILRKVLRRENVGLRERNELLAILAPMKHEVVEK